MARLAPSGTAYIDPVSTRGPKIKAIRHRAYHIPDASLATPVVPFRGAEEVQPARFPVIPDLLIFIDAKLPNCERKLVFTTLALLFTTVLVHRIFARNRRE